jgi:hypothetical protein
MVSARAAQFSADQQVIATEAMKARAVSRAGAGAFGGDEKARRIFCA